MPSQRPTRLATPSTPTLARDHRPLPAAALGAAADAAPRAGGGGLRHRRRHRVLRRDARPHHGRGHRGRDFYTMYKRRPVGDYHVGVCTNTLCAVMGGDAIFGRLKEHLGVGNDETTADGKITLEHVECNAACDYAPVVMVNWEFFDNLTPAVGQAAGRRPARRATRSSSTRGPARCAPGARPSGSWPASPTAWPTRARRPGRPAWSASSWPGSAAGPRPADTPTRVRRRAGSTADSGRRTALARRPRTAGPDRRRQEEGSSDRHADPGPHRALGRAGLLDARRPTSARGGYGALRKALAMAAGRRDHRWSRTPACAAAAAPASRPA